MVISGGEVNGLLLKRLGILAHLHFGVEIILRAKLIESRENSEIRVVPRGVEPHVLPDNGF